MMTGFMYLLPARSAIIVVIVNTVLMKQEMELLTIASATLILILYNSDRISLYAGNIKPVLNYILCGRREIHQMHLVILILRLQKVCLTMRLQTRPGIYFC